MIADLSCRDYSHSRIVAWADPSGAVGIVDDLLLTDKNIEFSKSDGTISRGSGHLVLRKTKPPTEMLADNI